MKSCNSFWMCLLLCCCCAWRHHKHIYSLLLLELWHVNAVISKGSIDQLALKRKQMFRIKEVTDMLWNFSVAALYRPYYFIYPQNKHKTSCLVNNDKYMINMPITRTNNLNGKAGNTKRYFVTKVGKMHCIFDGHQLLKIRHYTAVFMWWVWYFKFEVQMFEYWHH